jgi:predicted component of type VI protein secretion system
MNYIQIDRTNFVEIILQEFPAFRTQWELHLESWNSLVERPVALDIAEFADFAIDTICTGVDVEVDKIVGITEQMLDRGDSVIRYAFRRMFLEQIAHRRTRGGFPIDRFTSKLQPLGYYHWQAMDQSWAIHPQGVAID